MTLHITSSKTDQYRQGDYVIVARTYPNTCPVSMMERYMLMADIKPASSLHGIVHTKKGQWLCQSGSLSYMRKRELFLSKLSALGFEAKQFGLHSLRAGGASAAANVGIPDRLFKRHGCWNQKQQKMATLRIPW